uniref:Uncharacterized protein n=1 Tax=Arion vulgaris TaxID=1028688 RepID=A0A0B7AG19_9EUPU
MSEDKACLMTWTSDEENPPNRKFNNICMEKTGLCPDNKSEASTTHWPRPQTDRYVR